MRVSPAECLTDPGDHPVKQFQCRTRLVLGDRHWWADSQHGAGQRSQQVDAVSAVGAQVARFDNCLLYTSPSPRD